MSQETVLGAIFQVGALAGTLLERTAGYGFVIADCYPIEPGGMLIAICHSSANTVVLGGGPGSQDQWAQAIALLRSRYARMKQSLKLGTADWVLNNQVLREMPS